MSGTEYYSYSVRITEKSSQFPTKMEFTITSELNYTEVKEVTQKLVDIKERLDKYISCYNYEGSDNDLDNELSKFYKSYGFRVNLCSYANMGWYERIRTILDILLDEITSEDYYICSTDEDIIEIEC